MKILFITESDTGARWYNVDGNEVGLALDGTLMHGEGGNFDCVDSASIAEKESIISAINEFESRNS